MIDVFTLNCIHNLNEYNYNALIFISELSRSRDEYS